MAISIIDAAAFLGVKEETVRKWLRNKELMEKLKLRLKIHKFGRYNYVEFNKPDLVRIKKMLKPRNQWKTGQSLFRF